MHTTDELQPAEQRPSKDIQHESKTALEDDRNTLDICK